MGTKEFKEFKTKYDYSVYIIEQNNIEEITMKEYLERYWNDHTTTPEGLANRTQIRAILVGRNGELLNYNRYEENLDPEYYKNEEDGWIPEIRYGTFTWTGAWGNGPFVWNGDEYDSWEEAYESILDRFNHDFQTKSANVPIPYLNKEDAEDELKEILFFERYGYYPTKNELDKLTIEQILNDYDE
jgi:hypothetical protein